MHMTSATLRHSARLVPVALAGALVLGACGSESQNADDDTVPSATDGDGLLAPKAVHTSGGGANGAATPSAAESAGGRVAGDAMIAPYRITNFVLGDNLPALPTNDTGYVFQMGQDVTPEQVSQLAAQLGVTGDPVKIDDGYSISWRVGPDDGSAPSVWVYQDAQLSWSYNSAWATSPSYGGCAVAEPGVAVDAVEVSGGGSDGSAGAPDVAVAPPDSIDPGTTVDPVPVDTCAEPEPPEGVPTAAEAEAQARDLVAKLGLDPAAFTFEPYADDWFASVSAVEQLDGMFAGRRVDLGFGAGGVMQYAGGQLASPSKMGPYPLIGIDAALARLNDQSGFYGGGYGVMDMARSTVGGDVAVTSEAIPPAADDAAGAPAVIEPMPPVDSIAPEEVTVTLTDVQADVWWAWDVDGSVYLLPAYRFIGDDGGWYTVPAVTDEFLVQSDVPVPVDTAPPATEPGTLPPTTEPVVTMPAETVPPATDSVPVDSKPEPTETIVEPDVFDSTQLDASIGKSVADFTADAEALGATVRVTVIDGVDQAVTMDYSYNRVNVSVEGGDGPDAIVVAIVGVG